jgi:hypothetical protein
VPSNLVTPHPNLTSALPFNKYGVRAVLTLFFKTNINLHKILKNNNCLMKLSGIVIYSWTLHLAEEIAFSSNNLL